MAKQDKQTRARIQAILSAADAGFSATTVELAGQFLKLSPGSLRARLDQATALTNLFRYDEAEEVLKQALALCQQQDQNPAGVNGLLGRLEQQRGRFADAIEYYSRQIQNDSDDAAGFLQLGALLLQQGAMDEAEKTIRQSLDCTTINMAEVHYSLGLCQLAQNELADARASFQTSVDADSGFLPAQRALKDTKSAISAARQRS